MKSGDQTNISDHDARVAFCLQEQDDAILCAFGPDFFDGARKGAACGGIFTAWLTYKTFMNLRGEHHILDAGIPKRLRDTAWTISRGFRYRPLFTLGCVALGLTTVLKTIKFSSANYRYKEFIADDVGFELLLKMYAENSENRVQPDRFVDKVVNSPKESASIRDHTVDGSRGRSLTEFLAAKNPHDLAVVSSMVDRRPPTFWDGVSVGLIGSVMDCYLPSKPVYCYYNMRCGMRH